METWFVGSPGRGWEQTQVGGHLFELPRRQFQLNFFSFSAEHRFTHQKLKNIHVYRNHGICGTTNGPCRLTTLACWRHPSMTNTASTKRTLTARKTLFNRWRTVTVWMHPWRIYQSKATMRKSTSSRGGRSYGKPTVDWVFWAERWIPVNLFWPAICFNFGFKCILVFS